MTDAEEIAAAQALAAKPASQSADGVSESTRSAADWIALQKHRRALEAQVAGGPGITIFQIVPPGGTG